VLIEVRPRAARELTRADAVPGARPQHPKIFMLVVTAALQSGHSRLLPSISAQQPAHTQ